MAKEGAHEKLEKVLVKWLLQARSSAINIDGAILKEKADLVALRLGIDGFKASNGWRMQAPVDDDDFERLHPSTTFAEFVEAD
ncbi:hypothetical protein HPB49_020801 [Dermacentor silvarum]|uniref:Uncharacterized protein n=1 Tax=Dermacentor silvarum TaxID=543639 RepID=A0ACB8DKR9_DERSI|nr:hypothetical protein HPB49_020801 [Dermacentor silvarum]